MSIHLLEQLGIESVTLLSKGSFGTVFIWRDSKGRAFAAKKISNDVNIKLIQTELAAGKLLSNHPNIPAIRHFANIPSEKSYYIVFDYIENSKDLYQYLERTKFTPFAEPLVIHIFTQLLSTVAYLHEVVHIAHRDIKLDNILLDSENKVYLIDFGLCGKLSQTRGKSMVDWYGSSEYLAPEIVLRIPYDGRKADIYSRKIDNRHLINFLVGVVLYCMLFAEFPFNNKLRRETLQKTGKHPEIRLPEWVLVSDHAKDLVLRMLEVNPDKRISLQEIKQHPWIKSLTTPTVN